MEQEENKLLQGILCLPNQHYGSSAKLYLIGDAGAVAHCSKVACYPDEHSYMLRASRRASLRHIISGGGWSIRGRRGIAELNLGTGLFSEVSDAVPKIEDIRALLRPYVAQKGSLLERQLLRLHRWCSAADADFWKRFG
ncbi:hypothetical protein ACE15N_21855 (plasmid) [Xanthomonas campestris pv. passiflorae]